MSSVIIQVLFNKSIDFEVFIKETLVSVSSEIDGFLNKENVDGIFDISYTNKISDSKYLVGFEILLEEYPQEEQLKKQFVDTLCEYLDGDSTELLIKYEDYQLKQQLIKYYDEIFTLEMRLREIFSYIYMSSYVNDCYSFLEFQRQKVTPIYKKGVREKDVPEKLKKRKENEFFYLTFNQYRQLKIPDVIKSETITDLIANCSSLEDFKESINKIGVFHKDNKLFCDFLNKLNQELEPIETLRNCVAHNREPTIDEMSDYLRSHEQITNIINDFLSNINYIKIVKSKILVAKNESGNYNLLPILYDKNDNAYELEEIEFEKDDISDNECLSNYVKLYYLEEWKKEDFQYDTKSIDDEDINVVILDDT
jgi:hypothetical protein